MRVLIVSHTFPPDSAVGGLRIARLCRYLPECDIHPFVLTVEDRVYESVDPSMVLPSNLKVIRTGSMSTPLDWYRRLIQHRRSQTGDVGKVQGRGPNSSLARQHLLAMLSFPDRYWGWYLPALKAAGELIRTDKVEAVFSSGPPWISHLIARRLKLTHKLPWMADFRDPWAHLLPEKRSPGWFQRLSERLEERCIGSADLVICNTDRLREAFQNHYSVEAPSKFRTLTNGFDDSDAYATAAAPAPKRLFLHLGSIYGLRRIDTFLEAISQLTRSGQLDPDSFQLVFQGEIDSDYITQAEAICPELLRKRCLEFRPRINRNQAQQVLASADRLLLFQGSHELQVPAKFYEYLQTGIPIFAVTEPGALTDLLQETDSGIWASPSNSNEIAERFLKFLEMPRRSPESLRLDINGKFQYRQLASRLGDWMRELVGSKQDAPLPAIANSRA